MQFLMVEGFLITLIVSIFWENDCLNICLDTQAETSGKPGKCLRFPWRKWALGGPSIECPIEW